MRTEIFVVGCARSGTTLMSSILMSSSLFAEYHAESLIMSVCMPKYGSLASEEQKRVFIDDWWASRQGMRSGLSKQEFTEIVEASDSNYFLIHKKLMDTICEHQQKPCWSDSTPANVFHLKRIFSEFTDCHVIHMIRDGRDVALSLEKLGWISIPFGIQNRALRLWWAGHQWRDSVRAGRKAKNIKAQENGITEVRYEDLVCHPHEEIDRISRAIGIDLSALFDADGTLTLKESNSAYGDTVTTLSSHSLGRWKKTLSAKQIKYIEAACYKELAAHGYPSSIGKLTKLLFFVPNRLASAFLRFKHWLRFNTALGRRISETLEMEDD